MAETGAEIVRCPPERLQESLGLVLVELSPNQRQEVATTLLHVEDPHELANEPLWISLQSGEISGAAWGQRLSGNLAIFWPPRLNAGTDDAVADQLAAAVIADLDHKNIDLTQVLLESPSESEIERLRRLGFRHLADLDFLTCEAERFPRTHTSTDIQFEAYTGRERARLAGLIERTYEGTLDCTDLNGVRDIDDVIIGYQGTGVYRPENWFFVRFDNADIGVLLLADHPAAAYWELVYMGLVPEARGRGWGRQIVLQSQWLGRRAKIDRIVLAVDTSNLPAVRTYAKSGFHSWNKRSVYIRGGCRSAVIDVNS